MAVALLPPGLGLAGRSVVAFVVLYALLLHGDAFERVPATQRRFGLDYLALLGDVSGLAQRQRTGEISIPELIVGLDRLISALEGLEPPDGGWEQLRAATVRHLRAQIRRYQAIAAGQPLAEEEFSAADSEVDRLHAQYSTLMRN
jgi:hypothetical protein